MPTIAPDKAAHFLGGWAIVATLQAHTGAVWALAVCAVLAFAKEWRDSKGFGTCDQKDFWATVAGGALALLADSLIQLLMHATP